MPRRQSERRSSEGRRTRMAGTYFAVVGDIHGHYDELADTLSEVLASLPEPVELSAVLAVGDAEAQRTPGEMEEVHGPAKYRSLGTFHRVASGDITLPAPLYFIGGNHEPWFSLDEDGGLADGGGDWAAGVVWLGRAGVAEILGLRIGFVSGIHSPVGSLRTSKERRHPPTDGKRRTYWIRDDLDRVRADAANGSVDVLLTHEWPAGIGTDRTGRPVGSPDLRALIQDLRPAMSFHGHMHHPQQGHVPPTEVHCLPSIRDGAAAIAIIRVAEDKTLHRIC